MSVCTYKGLRIITSHDYPPIPWRHVDWSAHVDTWGADCSPYGRGATEAEALADLQEQLDEMEEEGAL